jgi:subtilase family serine protease
MRPIQKVTSTVAAAILVAGGLAFGAAAPAQAKPLGFRQMNSCGSSSARGFARCMAVVRTTVSGLQASGTARAAAATPSGLSPASLQSAYKLPSSSAGAGRTIAIVDAYDDPNAEADLGTYRSYFGLPACTTANGCFKKVSQTGSTTSLPSKDGGWAEEISLDIDMVSAICPNCKILLVEAKSASFANLGAAVNEAAVLGANAISNSYGGSDAADSSYGAYYNHPGIAVTASSGDDGYGASYPASSHYVTAVGGTTLKTSSTTRGWTETAWADAGSGCSAYNAALSGQASFSTGCSKRAEADVSAVADPATGVSVYDSYAYQGYSGWLTFGGTSASAPIIAGVYGLAGNGASIDNNYPYTHSTGLFDVTSGSNGTCSTSQWCKARAGWDGPTGLGTPNGVSAF